MSHFDIITSMKYSQKQKTFTIIGIIVILSTPLLVIFGSRPLADLFCVNNQTLQTICLGTATPMTWGILALGSLLVGAALILIGSLVKK